MLTTTKDYLPASTEAGAQRKGTRVTRATQASRATPATTAVLLRHGQAMRRLKGAGLRWRSSGGCTDRRLRYCTSFTAVRRATVADVIELKRRSGCRIVVTGGTETGHAAGAYSHAAGYKLDIMLNRCIDRFITGTYPSHQMRSDGARMYRSPDGDLYAREHDHWDILFR